MTRLPLVVLLVACGPSDPGKTDPTVPTWTSTGTTTGTTSPIQPSSFTWTDGGDTVTVVVDDEASPARTYTLSSTHPQRDAGPSQVTVVELPGQPTLRSGSVIFDALFALALQEARQLSVSEIRDGAFDGGAAIPCDCFQTGAQWTYVWTRDTAYAADLGLAWIDPVRARDSLDFKLSADKAAVGTGGLQIVQDTGTGGSWPVSTDRVVWALGARRVLALLPADERAAFRDRALEAVVNTAEVDRLYAWDAEDGLYRGETSFLDWREQTYPQWTAADVSHIAEGKALSTNLGHRALLLLASDLSAEVGDAAGEARYRAWADALSAAIDRFWLGDRYGRVLPNALDPGPLAHLDWLGTSLASLSGADPGRATSALSTYPHGPHGPPVIWPQQPEVPVYHNRAIWPFVTAYGVRAGVRHGHEAVVERGVHSLTRGALLNLSNMENLELQTGANWLDDGAFSGPVVNSRAQLWSVAGYVGMVLDLAGLRAELDGLYVEPFVPQAVADAWMGGEVVLRGLSWRGRDFDLVLELPASGAGPLVASRVLVGGVERGLPLTETELADGAEVRVELVHTATSGATLAEMVDDGDFTKIYAPRDPAITALVEGGGGLELTLDAGGEAGVVFDVWRDGVEVAAGVAGPTWVDAGVDLAATSPCYAVSTRFASSGHVSQRSRPVCWWGAAGERVKWLGPWDWVPTGATWRGPPGAHWGDWGNADGAAVHGIRADWTGRHLVQVVHANGAGPVQTGVAAAVKWLEIRDPTGAVVAMGPVVMPQSGDWTAVRDSTGVFADLQAGVSYTLELVDGPNMSRLEHFERYTAGLGGGPEAFGYADLYGVKLLPLSGVDETPPTGALAVFDGVDDVQKLVPSCHITPGATLQPWEVVGLDRDEDFLYLAWVSQAFEGDFRPLLLYVEASAGPLGPAVPGLGLEYDLLVPELPFTPTHAISLRPLSDTGDPAGPWDAVRVNDGSWSVVRRFEPDRDRFLAADRHTLSVRIPRSLLGDPAYLRLAGHVVNAAPGSEWVDTVPAGHTPWAAGGGAFLEVDLSAAPPW